MNNEEKALQDPHFPTKAVHTGQDPEQWTHGEVVPPISMTSTFQLQIPMKPGDFIYSRLSNPTRNCLEKCIAALEDAKYGLCHSSGLATIENIVHLLKVGDNIICFDDVYGGTNEFFRVCAENMGLKTTFVDAKNLDNVRKAIRLNTKMIWMETPTNPTMKLVDIKAIADIAKNAASSPILVVDNTFMSPYFQRPLKLGADIVMHSVSKYMNGHSDVIMGAAATDNEKLYSRLLFLQHALGAIPSPFDCFLVNRGLKTLHVRMERHMENGLAVARFLEKHPMIEKVLHPGLPSHPQHELAKRQCSGFSGMVSFYIKGGLEEAQIFVKNLKWFIVAVSLGSVESLVEIPFLMTHQNVPEGHRKKVGITSNLIRLSVGLETKEDLLSDLSQALKSVQNWSHNRQQFKSA
ncbi:cystathionine gamma-lyase-like [Centruroides sculpturatus]|uniref:cystathionine gamma-lyase-like n=1 Tax=Centruroides sculpturatus TaxID=218467 RepID=UPI000C6D7B66|nr:cystathionine gamma-lyase-like [Centruroides sculpturatus]